MAQSWHPWLGSAGISWAIHDPALEATSSPTSLGWPQLRILGALPVLSAGALPVLSVLSVLSVPGIAGGLVVAHLLYKLLSILNGSERWIALGTCGNKMEHAHPHTHIYIYILHTFIRAYIEILFNIIWWFWFWLWHRLNTHCCAPFMSGNKGRDSLAFDTHESLSTTRASPFPKIKYTSKINGPPRSMDQIHPIKSIKH